VATGKQHSEMVYGVSSLNDKQADATRLLEIVRKHLMIENGLHYQRGWSLREDYCRLRIGTAAQAMAVLNNLVVGLVLRQGFKYLPDARRLYSARPLEGLRAGCKLKEAGEKRDKIEDRIRQSGKPYVRLDPLRSIMAAP
jgi:hypothetical protein